MYQIKPLDSLLLSLSKKDFLAVEMCRQCNLSAKEVQKSICQVSYVKDWSPAFDFINEREIPRITGNFCAVHRNLLDEAHPICPGAYDRVIGDLSVGARDFLFDSLKVWGNIYKMLSEFGMGDEIHNLHKYAPPNS